MGSLECLQHANSKIYRPDQFAPRPLWPLEWDIALGTPGVPLTTHSALVYPWLPRVNCTKGNPDTTCMFSRRLWRQSWCLPEGPMPFPKCICDISRATGVIEHHREPKNTSKLHQTASKLPFFELLSIRLPAWPSSIPEVLCGDADSI